MEKKYIIDDDVLGQGTFATVYKARNRVTRQEVAVKIIDKANSRRDLLNTEIWILQNFGNHPNIVNLYDMYETEDEVLLVIEIMMGGELFDLLDENGPYGEADAAKYLRSIAAGLAYLHEGGVAHRDLKPENLLLTSKGPEGVLKISDFGLAKILIDEDIMKVACGTWIYCAPEVLLLKQNKVGVYDIKCDVFSVGCILFIMMGGYHPFDFDGNDDEELMQECILSDTWDFEDPAWNNVSIRARDLMEEMLKFDPRERLTAQQVLDHSWTQGKMPHGNLHDNIDKGNMYSVNPFGGNQLEATGVEAHGIRTNIPSQSEGTGGSMSAEEPAIGDGGTGGLLPCKVGVAGEESSGDARRGSLDSKDSKSKRMPKKHVPRPGSRTEDVKSFIEAEVGLELKGVGASFNPKANEARWEKYYLKHGGAEHQQQKGAAMEVRAAGAQETVERPDDADAQAPSDAQSVNLEKTTVIAPSPLGLASPVFSGEPHSVVPSAAELAEQMGDLLKGCPSIAEQAETQKKRISVKPKAKAKITIGNTRQFASVADWKAKQVPQLVKEDVNDVAAVAGAKRKSVRASVKTPKAGAKAKTKAKAKKVTAQDKAKVAIDDPRSPNQKVEVIGFYHPGQDEPCDSLCGAPFLGNFWNLGAHSLRITAPNSSNEVAFANSEAAFQALKFWNKADQFAPLSGDGAFQLKKSLNGQEDFTFGGYGSNWLGMMAVLRVKFAEASMQKRLLQTEDAYLLEHNSVEGRDKVWSDNCKGDGTNWLGLQIMLIRDEINGTSGWTTFISKHIDLNTGNPTSGADSDECQFLVQKTCAALTVALQSANIIAPPASGAPACMLAGCGKPTWNNQLHEYCSNTHRQQGQATPICRLGGCTKPTWNNQANEYCSNTHRQQGQGGSVPIASVCMLPGCGKPTWNLQPNEYCSRSHRATAGA